MEKIINFQKNKVNFLFVRKNLPSITVLILVRSGTEYEHKKINGISHFLEHLCFKGTKNYPTPQSLLAEFDNLGINYNAFTSYEYIGYWARGSYEQFKKIIFLVGDILLNPLFASEEIEKEKGVVIEEINLYKDTPSRYIWDLFLETIFQNQPAGWPISGSEENIKNITRNDILNFYKKFYVSPNILVTVAGPIKNKDIEYTIDIFKDVPSGQKAIKYKFQQPKLPKIKILFKETNQYHLGVGFPSVSLTSKFYWHYNLLANLIGGMMSSPMFERVRSKMGAAYYIRTENESFIDHGFFATFAGLKKELLIDGLEEILKVFQETKFKISEEDFERAKSNFLGRFIIDLETSNDLAWFYGLNKLLTDRIEKPKEIILKIKQINKIELIEVAKKTFRKENIALSIIGDLKDSFKKIKTLIDKIIK